LGPPRFLGSKGVGSIFFGGILGEPRRGNIGIANQGKSGKLARGFSRMVVERKKSGRSLADNRMVKRKIDYLMNAAGAPAMGVTKGPGKMVSEKQENGRKGGGQNFGEGRVGVFN